MENFAICYDISQLKSGKKNVLYFDGSHKSYELSRELEHTLKNNRDISFNATNTSFWVFTFDRLASFLCFSLNSIFHTINSARVHLEKVASKSKQNPQTDPSSSLENEQNANSSSREHPTCPGAPPIPFIQRLIKKGETPFIVLLGSVLFISMNLGPGLRLRAFLVLSNVISVDLCQRGVPPGERLLIFATNNSQYFTKNYYHQKKM
jgi:hypothetical protein